MINLDFADIRTVMGNMGKAMMGTGESSGDDRAKNAAEAALNNPLLDDSNIKGAKSILLNIKGGPDMALFEVDEAASKIRNEVDENANIIFGSSIDDSLEGIIRVSVVATGIDSIDIKVGLNENENKFQTNNLQKENSLINDIEESQIPEEKNINYEIQKANNIKDIPSEQIDLEVQINKLQEDKNIDLNYKTTNNEQSFTNNIQTSKNSENLEILIDKKPDNIFTDKKPDSILKRLSTFFNNNQIDENKVEPNINNLKSNDIDQNKFLVEENISHDENENIKLKNTNSNDLFYQNDKNNISNQQISLIDIEQNNEDIDESILEIPAFLRRQAN